MNYETVSFSEIFSDVTGGNKKTLQSEYLSSGKFPIVDQGKKFISGYTDDEDRLVRNKGPVIVFGDHTKQLKYIDFPFCLGADGTKVLIPKRGSDTRYLFHALHLVRFPEAGYSRHFKFLKEAKFPFPPIDEQRRIAAILDKADAIRRKRAETLALADQFLKSVFLEMFGDPTHPHEGMHVAELGVLGRIDTGKTPPTSEASNYGSEVPFLTPGDLGGRVFKTSRQISNKGAEYSKIVDYGATAVCCIGATIGKMGFVTQRSTFNQQINSITWNEKIDPIFGYVGMTFFSRKIADAGISTTLPILKKSLFSKICFPTPSVRLQKEFSEIARQIWSTQDKLARENYEADHLFSSLSQRAFRGEL